MNLLAEDQRDHLDIDPDLVGLKEWLIAEDRIIGDSGILRDEAARPDREIELAERNLAAQGGGQFAFYTRAEAIGVQKHWNCNDGHDDKCQQTAEND
jgi:hypothetical protein